MPTLDNPKHEAFAQAVAKGSSNREAYKAAGYSTKSDTVTDVNASRLLADARVASRVRELQEASAEEAVVTAADLSAQLEAIRKKAEDANQFGAAVQAAMGRAKLHGLIIDKAQVDATVTELPAEARKARIAQLLAKYAAD
jgi:hypothetical protein